MTTSRRHRCAGVDFSGDRPFPFAAPSATRIRRPYLASLFVIYTYYLFILLFIYLYYYYYYPPSVSSIAIRRLYLSSIPGTYLCYPPVSSVLVILACTHVCSVGADDGPSPKALVHVASRGSRLEARGQAPRHLSMWPVEARGWRLEGKPQGTCPCGQ